MNTTTTVALITLSSLSLIASGATLITVWVGAKNVQAEIDKMKMKTNYAVRDIKSVLENLEI